MTHNMTVTIEDPLWDEMKAHPEIRWGTVMKEAARDRLRAINGMKELSSKSRLSEKDIEDFALSLGKQITGRK